MPQAIVLILATLILAGFAGLIPMGNWLPDEYHDFGLFRSQGLSFWLQRLLTWSPRPISEVLVGLYFWAEEATRSQLIAPFLGAMALLLFVGPGLWAWRARGVEAVLDRVLIGAVTGCLFLLGHPVAEFFYWPMGAVAYVPTLAALSALTFQLLDNPAQTGASRSFCIACLVVAAGSAEVGAIFAIFYAASMIILHAAGRISPWRGAAAWLIPLLFGVGLMVLLSTGRGSLDEHLIFRGMSPDPKLQYHVWASIKRAMPTYFRIMTALDETQRDAAAVAWGLAVKLLLCLGLTASFRGAAALAPSGQRRLALLALIVALQATTVTSIAGSYFKFGLMCCERHDTFRQCLFVLTALSAAALASSLLPRPMRRARAVGAAALGVALVALIVPELPSLRAAYAVKHETISIRKANWQSGWSPGPQMTMLTAPLPPIVIGMMPPIDATFQAGTNTPWIINLIMDFFDKQEIQFKIVQEPHHPQ